VSRPEEQAAETAAGSAQGEATQGEAKSEAEAEEAIQTAVRASSRRRRCRGRRKRGPRTPSSADLSSDSGALKEGTRDFQEDCVEAAGRGVPAGLLHAGRGGPHDLSPLGPRVCPWCAPDRPLVGRMPRRPAGLLHAGKRWASGPQPHTLPTPLGRSSKGMSLLPLTDLSGYGARVA